MGLVPDGRERELEMRVTAQQRVPRCSPFRRYRPVVASPDGGVANKGRLLSQRAQCEFEVVNQPLGCRVGLPWRGDRGEIVPRTPLSVGLDRLLDRAVDRQQRPGSLQAHLRLQAQTLKIHGSRVGQVPAQQLQKIERVGRLPRRWPGPEQVVFQWLAPPARVCDPLVHPLGVGRHLAAELALRVECRVVALGTPGQTEASQAAIQL